MESTNIKVWKTRDYSVFKTLLGNRLVDESRVNKIMRSIEEVGYVPNPIIVNEKMEIIDGQGRVETLKRKGLPVYYIIAPGTGVNECISMNINQEQWHRIDYIRSYAERGDIHYQVLLQAIEEFAKDVPETSIIATVAGMLSFPRPKIVTEGRFQVGRPDWRNVLNYLRRYGSFREKIAGAWGKLDESIAMGI